MISLGVEGRRKWGWGGKEGLRRKSGQIGEWVREVKDRGEAEIAIHGKKLRRFRLFYETGSKAYENQKNQVFIISPRETWFTTSKPV